MDIAMLILTIISTAMAVASFIVSLIVKNDVKEIKNYNTSQVQSSIDISELNKGIYFVKIYTEKVVYTTKIIKE